MLINAYITADDYVAAVHCRRPTIFAHRTVRGLALLAAAIAFLAAAVPGLMAFVASVEQSAELHGFGALFEPSLMGPALIGGVLLGVAAKACIELIAGLGRPTTVPPADAPLMAQLAADGITGAHKYSISPRGVRVVTGSETRWIDWSLVTGSIDAGHSIKICIGREHWLLLPKSSMTSPEQVASVEQMVAAHAGTATAMRPARRQHLRPQDDDIVVLHGRITAADVVDRLTWQRLQHLPPSLKKFQALYLTPFGLAAAALASGAAGMSLLARLPAALWSNLAEMSFSEFLVLSLALLLIAGAMASFVQLLRRAFGLALGLPIGPKFYHWGPCDVSLTEQGVARATERFEERHAWSAFSGLAETRRLFILRRSPEKCFIVPKRLFPDEEARDAFRRLVAEKVGAAPAH